MQNMIKVMYEKRCFEDDKKGAVFPDMLRVVPTLDVLIEVHRARAVYSTVYSGLKLLFKLRVF